MYGPVVAHVILDYGSPPENPLPRRSLRERAKWVLAAFVRGAVAFGGKLALLTGLLGGSALAYVLFVADLGSAWTAAIALAALLVVLLTGAYQLWNQAYEQAWRFTPTWEQLQTRADVLRALVDEHAERGGGFKRQYMAGHMSQTRRDFDRAVAAGYTPDFDRDRIGNADLEDVRELVAAFDAVVTVWHSDARSNSNPSR